jgi:hypothetical protein
MKHFYILLALALALPVAVSASFNVRSVVKMYLENDRLHNTERHNENLKRNCAPV